MVLRFRSAHEKSSFLGGRVVRGHGRCPDVLHHPRRAGRPDGAVAAVPAAAAVLRTAVHPAVRRRHADVPAANPAVLLPAAAVLLPAATAVPLPSLSLGRRAPRNESPAFAFAGLLIFIHRIE